MVQIRPRRVDAFTPHVIHAVKHIVEDLNAQVRHADLVDVGETHGETDRDVSFVFYDGIHLTPDIALRLFDAEENFVIQCKFLHMYLLLQTCIYCMSTTNCRQKYKTVHLKDRLRF